MCGIGCAGELPYLTRRTLALPSSSSSSLWVAGCRAVRGPRDFSPPVVDRAAAIFLRPRGKKKGARVRGRQPAQHTTTKKKKAMDIATNIGRKDGDGEEGSPWSSAVVFRVCAVADAAAAAAAAASPAPACRVELDAGRALWLQVHACFPTLQTCQLAPIGDGPILALNREDDKPFLRLATPAGFLPWMPKYEWAVRGTLIPWLRRMNTTLVTARWKCDGSRCLAPGAPYVRVCCGALIIMDIALSAACFPGEGHLGVSSFGTTFVLFFFLLHFLLRCLFALFVRFVPLFACLFVTGVFF